MVNIKEYIHKCDADFKERLYDVADEVRKSFDTEKGGFAKVMTLSGPTCSGKTTAAHMISKRLEANGKRLRIISIDDFYCDREYLCKLSKYKGMEGIDYDSIDTIDLISFKSFLNAVTNGEEGICPIFDFKTGNRIGHKSIVPVEGDVFLFEGIQAIYPEIRTMLEPYGSVSVYIAPQTPISHGEKIFLPDEIRFMRRLVRDNNFRNSAPEFTMGLWKGVRRNEQIHIFPYANTCRYRVDSTHAYEIGVLKPYLERLMKTVSDDCEFYDVATQMLEKLDGIDAIDSALIDKDSLYREFV